MEIVWSDDATKDYFDNIDFLLREWSDEVAINFIDEVASVIELLKIYPNLYPKSAYKSIRRAVISKQISLFYTVTDSTILLVRFWNTFKDPESFNQP